MSVTSESSLASKALLLFKSSLRNQQSELRNTIDKTLKEIRALADSASADLMDNSCGNSCKEFMVATYSHNRARLRNVEAALERIATGEFGTCVACGGAIGLKRLQALPSANHCIECQEQSEQTRVQ